MLNRTLTIFLLILLATLSVSSPAFGQLPGLTPRGGGKAGGAEFHDSRAQVHVRVVPDRRQVVPGGDAVIAIILDHQPTWHTWTNAGNVPADMVSFDGAIHTEVKANVPEGSPIHPHVRFIQWPKVYGTMADLGDGPQKFAVFSDRAIAYLPVTIAADAPLGKARVETLVTFQACDDASCLPPVFELPLPVEFEIVDTEILAQAAQQIEESIFGGFDPSVFGRIRSGDAGAPVGAPGISQTPGAESRATFFGMPLPRADGVAGVLLLAVLSMIGGFILNLTPCVLPIIPIKILTISQHAGSPGRSLMLGLWMAIGVVAFWAGIGIPAALFSAAADPSRLFGIWWLTLGVGLLIAAMGVGIMGLFTIQLPAAAYAFNPKADTLWGSFWFGVMTAVLGLPCFGFVAGALLFGAAAMPASTIMIIFTSIGIGMAAPYLVLSAKPGLLAKIPRTGPASELVKQVMGLLLLAAGAYFIGSGLIALVIERPYLGRQLHWWAVALFVTAAGLWLIVRTFQITKRAQPRLAFSVLGLALSAAAIAYAVDTTVKAMDTDLWQEYSPAAFAQARAQNKVIVMDFTAEWCLTCKTLKATVLNREPVASHLRKNEVVPLMVDLTSTSAPGWQTLRELGYTGIPLLAIYTPGNEQPWLANAYTPEQVVAALDSARQTRIALQK